ncbi:MAG: RNA polymerase sigma factor [Elusimicrobiota bacterium]
MAPNIGQVSQNIAVNSRPAAARMAEWEVQLAQSAVSKLNGHVPSQLKPDVVKALISRLREEKASRSIAGAAGEDQARESVQRLLAEVLENAKKKAAITAFFRANHGRALAYAESILNNLAAAQDAVSQTCIEFLQGKTTAAHFFRALKWNARDISRRMSRETERFEPTEMVFNPQHLPGEDRVSGGESDEFSLEPASSSLEDQDPLDQLILREDEAERAAMVQAAIKDPRWRFCKRKKWAQPLLAHVPK